MRDAAHDPAGADDGERGREGDERVRHRVPDEGGDEHGLARQLRREGRQRQREQRDGGRVHRDDDAHGRLGHAEVAAHGPEQADRHEFGRDGEERGEPEHGDPDHRRRRDGDRRRVRVDGLVAGGGHGG
ncbi:hypothetical protein DEJ15_10720 [Curtobacterium sp. MCJR17_043]|nr:hypothetical protein [Curtobacterium sp. MCJR17_043]WIB34975.1 hypothetical protein DEJ15_10720 [Curtobacterium sp. MCJR17_043]